MFCSRRLTHSPTILGQVLEININLVVKFMVLNEHDGNTI